MKNINDAFELIGTYKNYDTETEFYHKRCGCNFISTPRKVSKMTIYCPKCSRSKRKTYEDFVQEVKEKRNDEFIVKSKEYKNNKQKMIFYHKICKNEFEMRVDCFLRGDQCPYCRKHGNQITNEEYVKKVKEKYGNEYEIVSKYRGKGDRITIKHHCSPTESYIFSTYASDFLHKDRKCPRCFASNHTSKSEKEILKFIKKIYNGEVIENNRSILGNNQELDIYLPEFKIAIEFNGLYWHSDINKPDNYHYLKSKKCEEKGIKLIHIFEDEWLDDTKRKIIKRKIRYLLNETSNLKRIYARKCITKEIDYKLASKFLNKFHIQGTDKANIYLGLYYNNKLYSVMSFCKPRKFLGKKSEFKYSYELSRFASNTNYIVIGAFSKLFKYFERNYEWDKIVTYSDTRYTSGNLYIKNGWKKIRENKQNYYVTDFKKRYNRTSFMKQKLKEKYPDLYNENMTEREITNNAGYHRIYDCGTITYIYERKSL